MTVVAFRLILLVEREWELVIVLKQSGLCKECAVFFGCTYISVYLTLKHSILFFYSETIGHIDQSEFAGFEYINPLLMSKIEEV